MIKQLLLKKKRSKQKRIAEEELTNKNKAITMVREMTKIPLKETGENISHFPSKGQIENNVEQQADLIFMPTDVYGGRDYKYILTVIDIGSRRLAARPLYSKNPDDIIKAFKAIYEHSGLKMPNQIDVDAGKEFRGATEKYFEDNGASIHRAEPNRHTQQSIIEANNRILVKYLFIYMNADEIETKKKSTKWVSRLPGGVKYINDYKDKNVKDQKPISINEPIKAEGKNRKLIEEGTAVRYALDSPVDIVTGKKTDSKFRTGDIRWSEPTVIEKLILVPGNPPRYMVKGKDNVTYSFNQIKVI